MSSSHKFSIGNFTISFRAADGENLPEVAYFLESHQLPPDHPSDFEFIVHYEQPPAFDELRQEIFRSRTWVLSEFQEKPFFEKWYISYPDIHLYAHFDAKDTTGDLYFQKNNYSGLYPLEDFLITDLLSIRGAGIIHASGIIWQNKAFFFSGFSGVGKSTIASLLRKMPGIQLMSDERIILRQQEGKIWAYGSPWFSTVKTTSPIGAPLEGIYFLRHGEQNNLTPIRPIMATALIYQQFFPASWDKEKHTANLQLIEDVVQSTPVSYLDFLPDSSVVNFLLNQWNE